MTRPRKPTAVKRLQGTLQPCRTPKNEPIPQHDLRGAPAPEYLTDTAKEFWTFSLAQVPEGLLSTVDYSVFVQWVVLFDQFIELSKEIKREGTIVQTEEGPEVSRVLGHLTKTAAALKSLETELGFTPAARSRVVAFTKDSPEKKNAFEDLD